MNKMKYNLYIYIKGIPSQEPKLNNHAQIFKQTLGFRDFPLLASWGSSAVSSSLFQYDFHHTTTQGREGRPQLFYLYSNASVCMETWILGLLAVEHARAFQCHKHLRKKASESTWWRLGGQLACTMRRTPCQPKHKTKM